jgi:hypothetical protein
MKNCQIAFYSGFNRCHWITVCRGFEIMSCQCLVSDAPEPFLPKIYIKIVSFLHMELFK